MLAAHGLRPCAATGSFICTNTETCSGEISNCPAKAMRHHLKKFHKLHKSVIATVWSAAVGQCHGALLALLDCLFQDWGRG